MYMYGRTRKIRCFIENEWVWWSAYIGTSVLALWCGRGWAGGVCLSWWLGVGLEAAECFTRSRLVPVRGMWASVSEGCRVLECVYLEVCFEELHHCGWDVRARL